MEEVRKRVMIVDDDPLFRKLVGSVLEKEYDIIYQVDGEEALTYITNGCVPDLIVLDVEMPNMNGRVFIRRLRIIPEGNSIPVIVVSGDDSSMRIKSFVRLGVIQYITKPFDLPKLIEAVHKANEWN
jgi:CheY-like chemotaxis protein